MSIISLHSPFDLSTVGGVRLRTLVVIRWVAIAGQVATILAVKFGFGMELPLDALLATITLKEAVERIAALQNMLDTLRRN
jgi:two-component system sensor histidine kinase RegB